ncbi:hypothetical protein QR680_011612 [Steinernema hermaphroditum]|uniref:Uncharacterized protein n=1 Tax=Steinernema hermaphroditum TaxID=289476 RepID=A0AA39I1J4_9BILA|nr:hypothetical protein QR680_011612 [Steinernema hermaphroditum]
MSHRVKQASGMKTGGVAVPEERGTVSSRIELQYGRQTSQTIRRSARGRGHSQSAARQNNGITSSYDSQNLNYVNGSKKKKKRVQSPSENNQNEMSPRRDWFVSHVNIRHRSIYDRHGDPAPDLQDPVLIRTMMWEQQNEARNAGMSFLQEGFQLPSLPPLSHSMESTDQHEVQNMADTENFLQNDRENGHYTALHAQITNLQNCINRIRMGPKVENGRRECV